jgi:dTDP-glucose pyrophosphorylase
MTAPLDRFFVAKELTLKAAMQQLEETEERILFVVDEDSRLFGAITDGDIRRWILADGSLTASVQVVCNKKPFTIPVEFQIEEARRVMLERKFACIPVLDGDGRIVDLLFWEQVFRDRPEIPSRRQPIDLPVVIMAGGRGTRLDPFTRILPKPLIPIGDKAVIEIIIESFTGYGVSDFVISVNHKAKLIKSFFEELQPPYAVRYLEEDKPLGTAGALRGLIGQVSGSLIVTNCDIIVRTDYADLVRTHEGDGNDITVVASLKTYPIPYGVCELEPGGRLKRVLEKPRYDLLVNTGMYVLRADTLDLIPQGEVCHATDLIETVQKRGGKIGVYPIGEKAWLDTGEWAEYRRTVHALSQ